jgi:hypothetical protein
MSGREAENGIWHGNRRIGNPSYEEVYATLGFSQAISGEGSDAEQCVHCTCRGVACLLRECVTATLSANQADVREFRPVQTGKRLLSISAHSRNSRAKVERAIRQVTWSLRNVPKIKPGSEVGQIGQL